MHFVCIGLGNPGSRFAETRHNVGFLVVEELCRHFGLRLRKAFFQPYESARTSLDEASDLKIIKPLTFINSSGKIFVRSPSLRPGPDTKVIAVADNMDLPLGTIRIKAHGGTAGHNGLKSLVSAIGHDFYPVYFGIGRPADPESVIDHVLDRFDESDRLRVAEAAQRASQGILTLITSGIEAAMNETNSRH